MSESVSETDSKNETIGQLFGLFGVTDETSKEVYNNNNVTEVTEEGQIIESNESYGQTSRQNIEFSEEIDENECIVCHSKQIKYRCPKCHSKTCSLECCKVHKTRLDCDGIRNKLSFVKIQDFTQSEFLSDYFFLEDVDRVLDCSFRERRSIISSQPILPKWLQKMVREARLRGIDLKIMPAGFQRRKRNTTCFMYNEKTINWDIELKFVHSLDSHIVKDLDQTLSDDLIVSHTEMSFFKTRVSENTTLLSLISEFIETNNSDENLERDRKLFLYRNSGIEGISVLFKDESREQKERLYFDLDFNKTIKENLRGKTVIEFPTFLVILNKFKHLFEIKAQKGVKNSDD